MARPSSYPEAPVEIELSDDLFSRFAVDVDKVAEQPPNHNLISERGSGRDDANGDRCERTDARRTGS